MFLLISAAVLVAFFIQQKNIPKYSALEYKNLNEECENFGKENYGETLVQQNDNDYISRRFGFSISFDSCFMKEEFYTTQSIGKNVRLSTIIDIYLNKKIISFNQQCLEDINYGEGMKNEQIDSICTPYSNIIAKEQEIWGK